MMRAMLLRAFRAAFVLAAVVSPFAAASAQAASLPAHAEVRAGTCVEPAAFRQLVSSRYDVEFKGVVAADIDRDGDTDVLATTDHTFTVWLNDGAGHLTSQRPAQDPAIDGRPPATTWREDADRTDPSTRDDVPTASIRLERAHAPPVVASSARVAQASVLLSFRISSSAPRAPPA
jgi:hypothetical protein